MEVEGAGAVVARVIGRIGNTIYQRGDIKRTVAREQYIEGKPSDKQEQWRLKYARVDVLWGELTEEEKNSWKAITRGKGHTRYSTFMKWNLNRIKRGLPLLRKPFN